MIQALSKIVLNYLIKQEVINNTSEDTEFYQYGIEITISSLLNVILVVILGMIFNAFFESLVFLLRFIIIRQFTGGYHAESYFKCNLSFCVLFLITLFTNNLIYTVFSTYIAILITFTCTSTIAFYCPIEHKNKPIPTNRRKAHKIMSILLSLSYGIVGTTLTVLSNKYGVLILPTLLLVTVLVVVAIVKKGG